MSASSTGTMLYFFLGRPSLPVRSILGAPGPLLMVSWGGSSGSTSPSSDNSWSFAGASWRSLGASWSSTGASRKSSSAHWDRHYPLHCLRPEQYREIQQAGFSASLALELL